MSPRLSILVAMTPDRVIGRDGSLPWHLPADLVRFKRLTMGHHIIMGRKTYESLTRSLPGRTIVILTRRHTDATCSSRRVASLDAARAASQDDDEVFIVGGAEVYRESLAVVDRMYQTIVHADMQGDTWFPDFDEKQWNVVDEEDRAPDDRNQYRMTFRTLDRA